jgi:hypothetical protein
LLWHTFYGLVENYIGGVRMTLKSLINLKRAKLVVAAYLAVSLVWTAAAPASAAVVISYDFSGTANAGGNIQSTNNFPVSDNALRVSGSPDIDTGLVTDFASLVGFGNNDPIRFLSGAASVGQSTATTTLRVTVDITNDNLFAADFSWNAVIFSGGVGIAQPDFTSPGCSLDEVDACDAFSSPGPSALNSNDSASLMFAASLDGAELFSGDISVDSTGPASTFNGIALDGFGLAAQNSNFFSWDETVFSQSLGTFAPGETRTLEFLVTATVSSDSLFRCNIQQPQTCLFSLAGFGDPPSGGGGGTTMGGGGGSRTMFFSFNPTPSEVPIPGAIWLFATGLGALAGRHKFSKRK